MNKIVSATQARKQFFALLEIAGRPGSNVIITLEGHPPLVMMSQEEFEGWQETLEIMSDPALMHDIRAAHHEMMTIPLEELEREEQARSNVRSRPQAAGKKAVRQAARARQTARSRRTSRTAR